MPAEILAALIGFLTAIIGGVVAGVYARRKNDADAAKSITDAATALVKPLTERIETLEKKDSEQDAEIERLKKTNTEQAATITKYLNRINDLTRGIRVLVTQLECAEIKPKWMPDDWRPE